jgi:phosphate transport system protein
MRQLFNEQLERMLERIMLMGGIAESMIETAVRGLRERDESTFAEVRAKEQEVNALQIEIDESAVRLAIQHQPVARDARFVFVASRTATDVERIADQAMNICQNTSYVLQSPAPDPLPDLFELAELVRKMVGDALEAMVTREMTLAERVLQVENRADALRDRVFRLLLNAIIADPLMAQRSLSLILISRNLERIGDHATNIAEEVIYLMNGEDVRHRFDRPVRQQASSEHTPSDST